MNKYGTIIAPNTIRFERLLPGPIERVWAYLTESEKRTKWLASGNMDLRVGGEVDLFWLHSTLDAAPSETPEKYAQGHRMAAKITRCEPPNVLGFTWGARAEALSEVVFELTEKGNEVLLVLTHHRLPDHKDLLSISGGWHTHLDILVEHMHNRIAPAFWPKHEILNARYHERLGKV
ncbi:MAG: SRPBCC family protein [Flavobacteriales bacterium]|nr:SRPBCC family protein [Flavobacteriales bacterium]MBK6944754.1 SRPBCC family protein [Flavobacteriales bacterium]MBK7241100.1 SRPBCC family protein [Flavobacteriales bacterium]MBK7295756.1 SRPBCC family protein [Flavobacteriales bacterium]MBK9534409.1 SRPBCC family protein [Flavobacteriales bacterium]